MTERGASLLAPRGGVGARASRRRHHPDGPSSAGPARGLRTLRPARPLRRGAPAWSGPCRTTSSRKPASLGSCGVQAGSGIYWRFSRDNSYDDQEPCRRRSHCRSRGLRLRAGNRARRSRRNRPDDPRPRGSPSDPRDDPRQDGVALWPRSAQGQHGRAPREGLSPPHPPNAAQSCAEARDIVPRGLTVTSP